MFSRIILSLYFPDNLALVSKQIFLIYMTNVRMHNIHHCGSHTNPAEENYFLRKVSQSCLHFVERISVLRGGTPLFMRAIRGCEWQFFPLRKCCKFQSYFVFSKYPRKENVHWIVYVYHAWSVELIDETNTLRKSCYCGHLCENMIFQSSIVVWNDYKNLKAILTETQSVYTWVNERVSAKQHWKSLKTTLITLVR